MRNVTFWLALLVAAAGLVWMLQGLSILPGTFMRGDPFWGWTGLACLVGGLGVAALARFRKPRV
ncbi:MAG TPA: hypothetical protein VFR15_08755 [Chloroflexia bacterium]|nr:hypothetical protein [Chloroflexia bacterium]